MKPSPHADASEPIRTSEERDRQSRFGNGFSTAQGSQPSMIRPLRSTLFTAAIGLVLNTAAAVHCHAYPFGKHGQTVYVVPSTTAVTTVGSAPVTYTTGSAPAAYTVGSAPPTYTTGSAPPTIIYQTQPATGMPPRPVRRRGIILALSAEDYNDIVLQLRELRAEETKDKDNKPTSADLRQTLTDRAKELLADACGKDAADFSAADNQLLRQLVRQALSDSRLPMPREWRGWRATAMPRARLRCRRCNTCNIPSMCNRP